MESVAASEARRHSRTLHPLGRSLCGFKDQLNGQRYTVEDQGIGRDGQEQTGRVAAG